MTDGKPAERVLNAQGLATRALILDAAGKVFAREGYAGACFRAISEESGVGLSSIVYHFKSKRNLYLETIRHFVIDQADLNGLVTPLTALADDSPPQAISDGLRDSMRAFLEVCHGADRIPYMNEMYVRILSDGDPDALAMLLECFVEVQEVLPQFLRRFWPELTDEDVAFWVQLFWSQLQYTIVGRALILYDMRLGDEYPEAFLDEAARRFARHCGLLLGLPEPSAFRREAP